MAEVPRRVIVTMVRQATRPRLPEETGRYCWNCTRPCWVTYDALEHAEVMAQRGRRILYCCIDCLTEAQHHGR